MGPQRRQVLSAGVGVVLAAGAASAAQGADKSKPVGKPGDFDFLTGEWRIKHRRLPGAGQAWDLFEGEATCWSILGGVGHVEELRIPARNFAGMGLRLLDVEGQVWVDRWVNAKSGVMGAGGQLGTFVDGVGTFEADDMDGETPIKVRGVWDDIGPGQCRWRQAVSRDGGKSWEENWIMDWRKA